MGDKVSKLIVYKAKIWKCLDEIGMLCLFGAFTVMYVIGLFDPTTPPAVLVMAVVFPAGFLYCLYFLAFLVRHIEIGDGHLVLKSLVRRTVLPNEHIESIQTLLLGGTWSTITIRSKDGRDLGIRLNSYELQEEIVKQLESRVLASRDEFFKGLLESGRTFRAAGFEGISVVLVIYLGAMLAVAPFERGSFGLYAALATVVGVAIGAMRLMKGRGQFVSLSADHIRVRDAESKRKEIRWCDIEKVNLMRQGQRRRLRMEHIVIEGGGTKIAIGEAFAEYPLIRDPILSKVPSPIVADRRGCED